MQNKSKRLSAYVLLIKYREIGLLCILALLIVGIGLRNPSFADPGNLLFIIEDTAMMAVLAAGMLCVLLVGSIDISISAIMALSAMVSGIVMRSFVAGAVTGGAYSGPPVIVLILISMGVGALVGSINGIVISFGKVLPIVTTLGMQYIIYGASHIVSGGKAVYRKDMSEEFLRFTRNSVLGINSKIWIMLAVYLVMYLFITYLRTGRNLYATGSNAEAAQVCGIPVKRMIVLAHIIMGALAGLAGMMNASHDTKITQDMASGYELYVIAACVIGGVAVTGGSGKITGVLLGALTIGVINNGLTMLRLTGNSEFWKKAIQGAVILAAVISNVVLQRVMDKQNLRRRNI
jgi:rhamnose transport system permease protein